MRWVLLLGLLWWHWLPWAYAGQGIGEESSYAREMGFEQRFYFVAAGSDGASQIEYICRAFPGMSANDDLTASIWQVQRFYYDTDDRLNRISFAGDDDGFNQACASRTSLNYD